MIGEASGLVSTMPPQVRSTWARAKTGKSSRAAAIGSSMMWKAPRWVYELYASMPAPITSSPLCAWLTYTWTALDMTTVGCTGSRSSETSACNGWLWMGSSMHAMAARTEVWPAEQRATWPAAMGPRLVWTPTTRLSTTSRPVTSQFWMMSMPAASAERARPQAT